jgi:hypothetical protein
MQPQLNRPSLAADPFALMMNPQAVLEAMAGSDRLAGLQRRVCRPLDKPLIPHRNADLAAFDSAIDAEVVEELDAGPAGE